MLSEIHTAGGEIYGLTSEPHSLACEAESAWDMSIPVIGDPHHDIRDELSRRDWLDIFYNKNYGHLRERGWANHPKGYFQPATIAIHKTGRVLYRWRCVPQYSNMSGAGARPEARYTWQAIRTALATPQPAEHEHAEMDHTPVMGARDLSWPQFLLVMTAHGWFLRPTAFPLLRDGSKDSLSPPRAMRRWYAFVAVWLIALIALPTTWVIAAFCLWLIALIPGLIEIHRQFQNEPGQI